MKKYAPFLMALGFVAGCSSEPEPEDPYSVQPGYGQPGYGQPGYGQPAYGQPAATTTAPAPAPTPAPAPATGGTFSLPCQTHSMCGSHVCNMTTQTCAFPCTGAQDCQAGHTCTMGVCLPGAAQQ